TGSTGGVASAGGAGSGSGVGSSGMPLTVLPGRYFAAACKWGAEGWGGAGVGTGADGGSGNRTAGTPGVPILLAIQGIAAANARAANGQSCLPGWVTTAHRMPLVLPNAHSELAAAVWSPAPVAAPLMSNQPTTPV